MSTGYVGFGNDELANLPKAKAGDEVMCPVCNGPHLLESGTDTDTGQPSELLLFYKCGEKTYLGAVAGRLVAKLHGKE